MNQNGFAKTWIVIIMLVIVVIAGYFVITQYRKAPLVELPELTEEIALGLFQSEAYWQGCHADGVAEEYQSCAMDIAKENNQWVVTITYDGFFDDSVRAGRIQMSVTYQDGQWVKGEVSEAWQCQPGRGHQDFSTELCV